MINAFFNQFFNPINKKENTFCIKGVSNSGKSEFLDRLREIFPCEKYIQ